MAFIAWQHVATVMVWTVGLQMPIDLHLLMMCLKLRKIRMKFTGRRYSCRERWIGWMLMCHSNEWLSHQMNFLDWISFSMLAATLTCIGQMRKSWTLWTVYQVVCHLCNVCYFSSQLLEGPMEYMAKLLWHHWCDLVISRKAISHSSLFANLGLLTFCWHLMPVLQYTLMSLVWY